MVFHVHISDTQVKMFCGIKLPQVADIQTTQVNMNMNNKQQAYPWTCDLEKTSQTI